MSDSTQELPAVSFSSFIVSLATSAMNALGEGPGGSVDVALAKQTIDLLGLLKDKTAGNLEDDETQLLDTLLYETRMKYMEHTSPGEQDA